MLWPDLCGYSDVYIVVKGTIIIEGRSSRGDNRSLAFKNDVLHLVAAYQRSIMY